MQCFLSFGDNRLFTWFSWTHLTFSSSRLYVDRLVLGGPSLVAIPACQGYVYGLVPEVPLKGNSEGTKYNVIAKHESRFLCGPPQ